MQKMHAYWIYYLKLNVCVARIAKKKKKRKETSHRGGNAYDSHKNRECIRYAETINAESTTKKASTTKKNAFKLAI